MILICPPGNPALGHQCNKGIIGNPVIFVRSKIDNVDILSTTFFGEVKGLVRVENSPCALLIVGTKLHRVATAVSLMF